MFITVISAQGLKEIPDAVHLTVDDSTVTVESADGTTEKFNGRVVLEATDNE